MGVSEDRVEQARHRTLLWARLATATGAFGLFSLVGWLSWMWFSRATGRTRALTPEEEYALRNEKWQKEHAEDAARRMAASPGKIQVGRVF